MRKNKSVILPGSYDPVTKGHLEMIKRASETFRDVYAVIFINPDKTYTFSLEDRVKMLTLATEGLDNVRVSFSPGYVVDYMREYSIDLIVKGYRNDIDLEYEKKQAEYNKNRGGYETELWRAADNMENISSTAARGAISRGEDLREILPEGVIRYIKERSFEA